MSAQANHVRPKAAVTLPAAILDRYVGNYRVSNGRMVGIRRDGARLLADAQDDSGELIAQDENNFYMPSVGVWISFLRDAAGKVTGFNGSGSGDFEARRVD